MQFTPVVGFFIALAVLTPQPARAESPELSFQRINVLVAHHDNRFSLRVWPDGLAEMRFPFYTRQAGLYRWQLESDELTRLRLLFETAAGIDPEHLQSSIAERRNQRLVTVADADLMRLVMADGRGGVREWVIESPMAWHQALPDFDELGALARVESELFSWMQARARELQP